MSKQTEVTYRIIASLPSAGIERSLPYEIQSQEEAEWLADTLERALHSYGYHHRVEPVISHHARKENSHAYHRTR